MIPNQEKGQFKKGESGNPNGRPKKLPQLDKLLADVLGEEKDGITAAEAILKALRAKATKGDIRAAELLLERGYGKSKQVIDMSVSDGIKQIIITPASQKKNDSDTTAS